MLSKKLSLILKKGNLCNCYYLKGTLLQSTLWKFSKIFNKFKKFGSESIFSSIATCRLLGYNSG